MAPALLMLTVVIAGVVAWLRWGRHGVGRYLNPPDVQACVGDWVAMMGIILAIWAWLVAGMRDALAYGWTAADVFVGVLAWLAPFAAVLATSNYLLIGIDLRRELLRGAGDEEELFERFIRLRRADNEGGSPDAGAGSGADPATDAS